MQKYLFLFFVLLVVIGGYVTWEYIRFNDGKLHVVFCDVGQGDAIYIRTPQGKSFVIDGGPDKSVLYCLSRHAPFWERTIDVMFLTHPHLDHFAGMHYLIDRYITKSFDTEELINTSEVFRSFFSALKKKRVPIRHLFAGDQYSLSDGVELKILAPTSTYLASSSPHGTIGETGEFASLVIKVTYGDFSVVLTGDSQVNGLKQINDTDIKNVTVLQMPHHGSKTGLDKIMIRKIAPKVAVVSVGKNKYGHPSKELLQLLANEDIPVFRTDEKGDIEIVSGGKMWQIR